MNKLIFLTCALFLAIFVSASAVPTEFPILRPAAVYTEEETTTEDLEAIVVEAATTTIDGILVVDDEGSGSNVMKEFDPNDCFLAKERGPCRAAIDSWYFNTNSKSCEHFLYSGCRGNNNRFREKSLCEKQCSLPFSPSSSSSSSPPASSEEPEATAPITTFSSAIESTTSSSTSTAATKELESVSSSTTTTTTTSSPISSSSFKPKLPVCPKFDGCSSKCVIIQDRSDRGCKKCLCGEPSNDDESKSKQQVPADIQISSDSGLKVEDKGTVSEPVGSVSGLPENEDSKTPVVVTNDETTPIIGKPQEVCQLPAKRGHCRAMQTRYRYDSKLKKCVQFHYGGCDANPNNFVSQEKCIEYCKGQ